MSYFNLVLQIHVHERCLNLHTPESHQSIVNKSKTILDKLPAATVAKPPQDKHHSDRLSTDKMQKLCVDWQDSAMNGLGPHMKVHSMLAKYNMNVKNYWMVSRDHLGISYVYETRP